MLEYFKIILLKVSFDKHLFEKELYKALTFLDILEIKELELWCYTKFTKNEKEIIDKVFKKKYQTGEEIKNNMDF